MAKANLVDDPCIKIQLQTEYRIQNIYIYTFFIKRISSCAKAGNSAL